MAPFSRDPDFYQMKIYQIKILYQSMSVIYPDTGCLTSMKCSAPLEVLSML